MLSHVYLRAPQPDTATLMRRHLSQVCPEAYVEVCVLIPTAYGERGQFAEMAADVWGASDCPASSLKPSSISFASLWKPRMEQDDLAFRNLDEVVHWAPISLRLLSYNGGHALSNRASACKRSELASERCGGLTRRADV